MNDPSLDPLLKAALGHAEFEALHPFAEGNGRIGRALITLALWADGIISRPCFYVSSEIERTRDLYVGRLRDVSAHDALTEWCRYFFDILARQAADNITQAERIMNFYNEMKEVFPELLSSKWAVQAPDDMFANPAFTNRSFSRRTGIPVQSAARFTRTLVEHGMLEIYSQGSGQLADSVRLPASARHCPALSRWFPGFVAHKTANVSDKAAGPAPRATAGRPLHRGWRRRAAGCGWARPAGRNRAGGRW